MILISELCKIRSVFTACRPNLQEKPPKFLVETILYYPANHHYQQHCICPMVLILLFGMYSRIMRDIFYWC